MKIERGRGSVSRGEPGASSTEAHTGCKLPLLTRPRHSCLEVPP